MDQLIESRIDQAIDALNDKLRAGRAAAPERVGLANIARTNQQRL